MNRTALLRYVDRVLDAMVMADAARLPGAPDLRYTENGQLLATDDGLWATLRTVGGYRIDAVEPGADDRAGQALFYGTVVENGIPGLLALRVAVADELLTEIEAVIVRTEKPGALVGVTGSLSSYTMFVPRPPHELDPELFGDPDPIWARPAPGTLSRAAAFAAADAYFDAVVGGPPPALDPAFARRENGATTPLPAGTAAGVRRRHLLVDAERGMLFGVYLLDQPGRVGETVEVARSYLSPHLFKIVDGRIALAESVSMTVPYRMAAPEPAVA